MKPASVKEMPMEKKLFSEAWKILETFYNIDALGKSGEWEALLTRANNLLIIGKEKDCTRELGRRLAIAITSYLDEKAREQYSQQEEREQKQ